MCRLPTLGRYSGNEVNSVSRPTTAAAAHCSTTVRRPASSVTCSCAGECGDARARPCLQPRIGQKYRRLQLVLGRQPAAMLLQIVITYTILMRKS